MRSVITFTAIAIVAGLTIPRFAAQMSIAHPASHRTAEHAAAQPDSGPTSPSAVAVAADELGHFRVDGSVDGRRLGFVIDTGASVVALTAEDAAMLGIHPAARDFTVRLRTANGTVRAAPTQLAMIEIGNLAVHDVAAVILPDGALAENLLGLSFLSRLHHFEYSAGKMILEQ